ncbi:hypothetical protein Tco_0764713 [Tanacetum coccineum]
MVLAGPWMANNDLDNFHLFDSLCTGRGEFLKEWATYDYYIVEFDGFDSLFLILLWFPIKWYTGHFFSLVVQCLLFLVVSHDVVLWAVISLLGHASFDEYQEYNTVPGFMHQVSKKLWGRSRQVLYSFFPCHALSHWVLHDRIFKEANLFRLLFWHFLCFLVKYGYRNELVYGDGSGDSDWPQDSLMIHIHGNYKPTIKDKDGKDVIITYEKYDENHKKMISKNDEAKMVLYNALPKKEYERIFMCDTAQDIWKSLIITHQGNKQVKDNKIDLFVQKYEEFIITDDETIDCAFARFNTIITSLKALDESFSSRNHVRKFLRALPTKWHPKVTAIEESKDLSTLPLDELIGNLKIYEVILKKDLEISKSKKEKYKSLALKARKALSEEEETSSNTDDEEYAMAVRDFKKFIRRRGKFVCQPYDDKKNFRKVKEDKK